MKRNILGTYFWIEIPPQKKNKKKNNKWPDFQGYWIGIIHGIIHESTNLAGGFKPVEKYSSKLESFQFKNLCNHFATILISAARELSERATLELSACRLRP